MFLCFLGRIGLRAKALGSRYAHPGIKSSPVCPDNQDVKRSKAFTCCFDGKCCCFQQLETVVWGLVVSNVEGTRAAYAAAFLLMCDQALEALEEFPKIPEIPIDDEPIIKDPIPDKPIVKEIPTATPVNQVHIHYSLSGLMKQINIFIAYCVILFAMYMYGKRMHASDELVCLSAPHAAPAPPSVMLGW